MSLHNRPLGWAALLTPLGVLALGCGGAQAPPGPENDGPRVEPGGVQIGTASPSRVGANKPAERTAEYEPVYYTRRVASAPDVAPEAARHGDTVPVAMERFDAPECEGIPPRSRRSCPLLVAIAAVEPVEGGFDVRFEPWVAVDKAVEVMRCHHAFGEAHGWHQMPFCPLYIPGLQMQALDETSVRFTVDGDEALQELERRLRAHERSDEATGADDRTGEMD